MAMAVRALLRARRCSLPLAFSYTHQWPSVATRLLLSTASKKVENRARSPKAVIFDVGGVITASPLPIFARFEEKHGLSQGSVVETIQLTGSSGAFAKLERGEYTVEQFSEPFARDFHSIFGIETVPGIFQELIENLHNDLRAQTVVLDVIGKLKERGIKTAIVTNNFRFNDGSTMIPKENLGVDLVCV